MIDEIHLVRRSYGQDFITEARLGKPFVVIKRQYVIPVARHARLRVWLSARRTDHVEQVRRVDGMIPFDPQAIDPGWVPSMMLNDTKRLFFLPR